MSLLSCMGLLGMVGRFELRGTGLCYAKEKHARREGSVDISTAAATVTLSGTAVTHLLSIRD